LNNVPVAIALGSNLGDRRGHLNWAAAQLSMTLRGLHLSTYIETDAQETLDVQPPYLNAAVTGECSTSAEQLLASLLDLEAERGRTRHGWHTARTLDLDLILYGDLVVAHEKLVVPHPRFRERRFVLEPLAQIAPDMRDPVTGKSVAELLAQLT
jgi:2-amino-4-hydroxy-6-hydroxymethyldihydropteridine diphosphokinase